MIFTIILIGLYILRFAVKKNNKSERGNEFSVLNKKSVTEFKKSVKKVFSVLGAALLAISLSMIMTFITNDIIFYCKGAAQNNVSKEPEKKYESRIKEYSNNSNHTLNLYSKKTLKYIRP